MLTAEDKGRILAALAAEEAELRASFAGSSFLDQEEIKASLAMIEKVEAAA